MSQRGICCKDSGINFDETTDIKLLTSKKYKRLRNLVLCKKQVGTNELVQNAVYYDVIDPNKYPMVIKFRRHLHT